MPPPPKANDNLDHRRTHNLLLISRLLNQRDNASPFTLILDSLSQSAKPLIGEYISRASASKSKIVYVSFETFCVPSKITTLIRVLKKSVEEIQKEILQEVPLGTKTLLIIDSLNPLSSLKPKALAPFLSALISPTTTLIGVYHTDVTLCLPPEGSPDAYPDSAPSPLTLLKYFGTTIIQLHSINHVLLEKQHRDKLLAPPQFGLDEGIEGVLVGLGSNPPEGIVIEMEFRRKSGRSVQEWFYMPLQDPRIPVSSLPGGITEKTILLEEHPEWRLSEQVKGDDLMESEDEEPQSTFKLDLTEKQRQARNEVVPPYFDAQRKDGNSGGGAILFTPDRVIDDFDEEEDEI